MKIKLQLFAAARDAVGNPTVELDLPSDAAVAALRGQLVAEYPALKPLRDSLLVAVNNEYASDETKLHETDEVACFPPVSGG